MVENSSSSLGGGVISPPAESFVQTQATSASGQTPSKSTKDTYVNLLKDIFQKIAKTLPSKKYKELIDLCKKASDECEADEELDANKYFYVLRLALETKLPRLMTDILQTIQKLYAHDWLSGDCADNCVYTDSATPKPPAKNGRLPRLLIDAIVEAVCDCAADSDNQMQLQVIKALLTIVIGVNSKVHESTLLIALKTLYSIHMTSTSQTNQNTAKGAFTQMVNTVFSKMEVFMKMGQQAQEKNNGQAQVNPFDLQRVSSCINNNTFGKLDKALLSKKGEESKTDSARSGSNKGSARTPKNSMGPVDITFSGEDQYAHTLVTMMVDFVALHDERVKVQNSESQNPTTDNNSEQQSPSKASSIPLNPVPQGRKDCPETPGLVNELDIEAGQFGWCVMCRNSANLFCKDTKHPVCSVECKLKHQAEIAQLDGTSLPTEGNNSAKGTTSNVDRGVDIPIPKVEGAKLAFSDAHLVFRSIVKLSIGDHIQSRDQQVNRFAMRTKIIGLELILFVLERPKQALFRKEFVEVIKNQLCDGLLRYSVSTETVIFQLVVSIFYSLFLHFRKHLKSIIRVFIETIFLKLLDSPNTSYQHKHLILQVFDKISRQTQMLLEIFVNFDCDISQQEITDRIVESLSKIANGKFNRSEHSQMISQQDEIQLRSYANQIFVQMLRSFNASIDAHITETKINEKMLQKSESFVQAEEISDSNSDKTSSTQQNAKDKQAQHMMGEIEQKRNLKNEMSKASQKFNMKPKNGIKYLVEQKLIEPADSDQHIPDIVKFLKTTPSLDKTVIGEFLGTDADLNKGCLYEFINQYNLKGVTFVQSLKTILQGFRLPGEGQVVDRIMEKFGEKFVGDNPDSSDGGIQGPMTAECVYLLSYATMMMQTSLHNPNAVKSRMTLDDFKKMIKGINSNQNLEPAFVQKIYETVEREPFTLNEDDDARIKAEGAQATTFRRKQELFEKEGQGLIDRGKAQIKATGTQSEQDKEGSKYISVEDIGPIKPMFENIWSANLATFSLILEETTIDSIAHLCIEGIILSIKICGFFHMETERDAFLSSLGKFIMISDAKRLKPKNIWCIQQMLELATHQGNYLGDSWYYVLDCVSHLEEMINMGSGQVRDSEFFDSQHQNQNQSRSGLMNMRQASKSQNANLKAQREANLAFNSALVVESISMGQIDQIFQMSNTLDQDAILKFIKSLCKVSKEELQDQTNPRKFSLQCLVEVADLNMERIRFVWTKLWKELSEHFEDVGKHSNLHVAIFAIDSLRQLSDKFLIREEFMSFNFQKDFLKPFHKIMLNNLHTRNEIKEYIVMCITNVCMTKTPHIKSGWSVIIDIFTLAAQDTEPQLVIQSFNALQAAATNHFDLLEKGLVELVNCLNKYSQQNRDTFGKQVQQAQDLLVQVAENLARKQEIIGQFIQKEGQQFYTQDQEILQQYPAQYGLVYNQASENEKNPIAGSAAVIQPESKNTNFKAASVDATQLAVCKGLWFPILTNFTNLALDRNLDNQTQALDNLFKVLKQAVPAEKQLSPVPDQFWREVFSQVLYPLLEDIQLALITSSKKSNEDEQNFYSKTISMIVRKFDQFLTENYDSLPAGTVEAYIDLICLFVANTRHKRLAQAIISEYADFIKQIGNKLSPSEWDMFTQAICLLFDKTLPRELLLQDSASEDNNKKPVDLDLQFTRCLTQLNLITCIKGCLSGFYSLFNAQQLQQILAQLKVSNQFAQEFNQKIDLRHKLWEMGFMGDLTTLPGLVAQEYHSLAQIVYINFMMYSKGQTNDDDALIAQCISVIQNYSHKTQEMHDLEKEQKALEQSGRPSIDEEEEDQEAGEKRDQLKQQKRIKLDELSRQIKNLTPIVNSYILANLNKLSDTQLRKHTRELTPVLIELSMSTDYGIRQQNKDLLHRFFNLVM